MTGASFPSWHMHVDTWMLVAALQAAYLIAVRRERSRQLRSGPADGGPEATRRGHVVAFTAGVVVLWAASDWPVHDLVEGYLYSAHMVQHLMLTLVAAPLLVLGTPAWLARRLLSPKWLLAAVRGLSRPVPNLVQFNVILVLSHWPLVVDTTIRHHPLHFVAHAVLLGSALVMWLPVASRLPEVPRMPPLGQMLYLFLQTIVPTVPASFLTFGETPLYPIYATFPRLWGISAVTDQQVAGLIMKIGGGFLLLGVIGVIFFRWYAREEGGHPRDVLMWDDVERELTRLGTKGPPPPP